MPDVAASVLARLKNKANESGRTYQLCLQLFCQEEIISAPTGNDFVTYEIKSVAPIAVAKKYAGIGASLVARIKNTKTPLNIDFGVGDVIVPKHEKRKIPTQLEKPTITVLCLKRSTNFFLSRLLQLWKAETM